MSVLQFLLDLLVGIAVIWCCTRWTWPVWWLEKRRQSPGRWSVGSVASVMLYVLALAAVYAWASGRL